MKLRHILLGFLCLSVCVAAVTGYLYYSAQSPEAGSGVAASAAGAVSAERGVTASGRAGTLLIAYAGDINGELGPCG